MPGWGREGWDSALRCIHLEYVRASFPDFINSSCFLRKRSLKSSQVYMVKANYISKAHLPSAEFWLGQDTHLISKPLSHSTTEGSPPLLPDRDACRSPNERCQGQQKCGACEGPSRWESPQLVRHRSMYDLSHSPETTGWAGVRPQADTLSWATLPFMLLNTCTSETQMVLSCDFFATQSYSLLTAHTINRQYIQIKNHTHAQIKKKKKKKRR